MNIQYITNEKGKPTAVIVPIDDWKQLKTEHEKLLNKLEVLNGVRDALHEVKGIKQGSKNKGRTIGEFLNG